jgi:hypothetical protein
MSKISTLLHISKHRGIRPALSAALKKLEHGESYRARFEIRRKWIGKLAGRDNLTAAEIGVREGRHADYLIDILDIGKLYLIDPYETYEEYTEDWASDEAMTEIEASARERLEGQISTTFVRKYSKDAVSEISEDLDFVYIDGNHDYEFVIDDISTYFPLLKEGGILAGHDYTDGWPGVIQAVDEFSQKHGLQVHRDMFGDWFIIKQTNN